MGTLNISKLNDLNAASKLQGCFLKLRIHQDPIELLTPRKLNTSKLPEMFTPTRSQRYDCAKEGPPIVWSGCTFKSVA